MLSSLLPYRPPLTRWPGKGCTGAGPPAVPAAASVAQKPAGLAAREAGPGLVVEGKIDCAELRLLRQRFDPTPHGGAHEEGDFLELLLGVAGPFHGSGQSLEDVGRPGVRSHRQQAGDSRFARVGGSDAPCVQFHGSLDELKSIVTSLDHPGHWEHKGAYEMFVFDEKQTNLRLNWWPDSGAITLVGDPADRDSYQAALAGLLDASTRSTAPAHES